MPINEAYDKKCIDNVIIKYTDYVKTGSRTATIAVRFTPTSNEIAPDPHPIPTTLVLRAADSKPADITTRGYTGGCKGCEYLSRKNHNVKCRLRMEELLANNEEGRQRLREAV